MAGIVPTGSMNNMDKTGVIKKTGTSQSAPTALDYNPITKGSKKTVDTTFKKNYTVTKKVKPPRDIPNSGINERAMFFRKHPHGLTKKLVKSKLVKGKKTVGSVFTDVAGSEGKFKKTLQSQLSKINQGANSAKMSAAQRRQAALTAFNQATEGLGAGADSIKSRYIERGLGHSGILQGALNEYNTKVAGQKAGYAKTRDAAIASANAAEAAARKNALAASQQQNKLYGAAIRGLKKRK